MLGGGKRQGDYSSFEGKKKKKTRKHFKPTGRHWGHSTAGNILFIF